MEKLNITQQINAKALSLLEQHSEGLSWAELRKQIEEANPSFHPKTVNGLIWKLAENFPDKVYKPERGVFRLTKFR